MLLSVRESDLTELVGPARLCFVSSGITLLLVEYFHTLPNEAHLIWPSSMSIAKLLFLIMRYGNFVFALAMFIYALSPLPSTETCKRLSAAILVMAVLLALLGEAVMYYRVWAFSGRSVRARNILMTVYLMLAAPACGLTVKYLIKSSGSTTIVSLRSTSGISCVQLSGEPVFAGLLHGALIVSITFLAGMTVAIGYTRFRISVAPGSRKLSSLVWEFYKGGLFYFITLISEDPAVINHGAEIDIGCTATNLMNVLLYVTVAQTHASVYKFNA
ncbi:hypothetical protein NMY22_g16535 [Coprinellus aureogranulatus]|nr:hypothetical protein NMY22_g16535 [Coprinellus aureogranulatus]